MIKRFNVNTSKWFQISDHKINIVRESRGKTEDRSQKTEDGRRKTEDRRQKTGDEREDLCITDDF